MATLYELTAQFQNLLEMASDPEVDWDIFEDTLEALEGDIETKADGYAKVIEQLDSEKAAIDYEIKRLTAQKVVRQNSIDRMKTVADWARQHKILNAAVVRTANSAMIRLHVPKLDMEKGFEYVDKDELNQCFEAVRELTDFANMIETVISVIHK